MHAQQATMHHLWVQFHVWGAWLERIRLLKLQAVLSVRRDHSPALPRLPAQQHVITAQQAHILELDFRLVPCALQERILMLQRQLAKVLVSYVLLEVILGLEQVIAPHVPLVNFQGVDSPAVLNVQRDTMQILQARHSVMQLSQDTTLLMEPRSSRVWLDIIPMYRHQPLAQGAVQDITQAALAPHYVLQLSQGIFLMRMAPALSLAQQVNI
jgi:hypothetical protein